MWRLRFQLWSFYVRATTSGHSLSSPKKKKKEKNSTVSRPRHNQQSNFDDHPKGCRSVSSRTRTLIPKNTTLISLVLSLRPHSSQDTPVQLRDPGRVPLSFSRPLPYSSSTSWPLSPDPTSLPEYLCPVRHREGPETVNLSGEVGSDCLTIPPINQSPPLYSWPFLSSFLLTLQTSSTSFSSTITSSLLTTQRHRYAVPDAGVDMASPTKSGWDRYHVSVLEN